MCWLPVGSGVSIHVLEQLPSLAIVVVAGLVFPGILQCWKSVPGFIQEPLLSRIRVGTVVVHYDYGSSVYSDIIS